MRLYRVILAWVIISAVGISVPMYPWFQSAKPDIENWQALIIEAAFATDVAILLFYLQDRKDAEAAGDVTVTRIPENDFLCPIQK